MDASSEQASESTGICIAAMYHRFTTGWNVVSLDIFIYFVGGTSESGECIVNLSNGSIRKFSLIVGLCYVVPFKSQLPLQFWANLLFDYPTY